MSLNQRVSLKTRFVWPFFPSCLLSSSLVLPLVLSRMSSCLVFSLFFTSSCVSDGPLSCLSSRLSYCVSCFASHPFSPLSCLSCYRLCCLSRWFSSCPVSLLLLSWLSCFLSRCLSSCPVSLLLLSCLSPCLSSCLSSCPVSRIVFGVASRVASRVGLSSRAEAGV